MGLFEATGNWSMALGKTIVHSLWIGFLLLMILRVILRVLPFGMSVLRYRISTLMLLLVAGVTAGLFMTLYAPDLKADQLPFRVSGFPVIAPLITGETTPPPTGSMIRRFYLLCCYIYFIGVAVMLIRSMISFVQVRKLRRSGSPVEGEWRRRFLRLKVKLRLDRQIDLFTSNEIGSPAVAGLIRPVILVPAGMFTHLSVQQVETILLHELYHLKRLDFIISLVQLVLENLFFYHPAVWIMSGWIRTEREHCCDDLVLKSCGNPFLYARALLQLAGDQCNADNLLIAAGGQDQFQLLNRIRRILNINTMKTNFREKLYGMMLFAGAILVFVIISGFTSGFSIIRYHDDAAESRLVPELPYADTVPESLDNEMEEIDWEAIKEEMEAARREAMEEIDWEAIKEEMEAARREVMEEIDWDAIEQELERSKVHLDSIKEHFDVNVDVDWENIREELERSMDEIEIDLDLDQLREEIERSMEEVDWEQLREEIERSMEEIDWERLKEEMEELHNHLDSLHTEMSM